MALESSSGNGLDTPRATQLAKMASKMNISKGLKVLGQGNNCLENIKENAQCLFIILFTVCSLIFLIVLSFIYFFLVFHLKCSVLKFLLNLFIFKMCICSIYKVLAFRFGSVFSCFNSTIDCFCCPHL